MNRAVDGRGFAFEPRTVVAQPGAFGKMRALLTPADGVRDDDPRFRAANLQHVLANAVNEQLLLRDAGPASDYPRESVTGLSADRIRRVFRGETAATMTDITYWTGEFPEVGEALTAFLRTWGA